jgi:endonuclease III related protein
VFVVDAYTRRILDRHKILPLAATDEAVTYEQVRRLFEAALAPLAESASRTAGGLIQPLATGFPDPPHLPSRMSSARRTALTQIYNEMHGLIVGVGKNYCKKSQPLCDGCPLQPLLPHL